MTNASKSDAIVDDFTWLAVGGPQSEYAEHTAGNVVGSASGGLALSDLIFTDASSHDSGCRDELLVLRSVIRAINLRRNPAPGSWS